MAYVQPAYRAVWIANGKVVFSNTIHFDCDKDATMWLDRNWRSEYAELQRLRGSDQWAAIAWTSPFDLVRR